MSTFTFVVAILMLGTLQYVRGQTIDELILLSQQPEDAKKAVAMQSPDSDTVMVELDMIYKKDTWQEMQNSRVELEDDYDYDYDNETESDTDSESEERTDSTESEETEESEESDCWHHTRSTGTASETRSTGTSSESESESDDESREHGHGHHGHHGHHNRGRGRGRGHGSRGHGHHSRGRHHQGHGRHGQNVYPRRHKRKAIRPLIYRWTNKEVPYLINSAFSADERRQIVAAIEDYKTYTCLKFPEKGSRTRNYINIVPGSGCSSLVGMVGGAQPLTLGNGCRVKSVILHELGHALGFQHEQTKPDRDGFVSIRRRNIYSGMEYNFDRYDTTMVNDYSIPYDYLSIMHYGQYAFSVNGERTIVTKDSSYQSRIGKAQGLSFRDIKLANTMYECNATCTQKRTCPQNGFQGKDCKCYCKGNPIKECDGTDDNTGTDEETTEEEVMCFDYHPLCSAWAAVGHCTNSRNFMTRYCQKSCDVCGDDGDDTDESECQDDDEHCAYWARNNHCTNRAYRAYMEMHCARSCLICGGNRSVTTTRAPAECKDRHYIRCKVRKLLGECRRNTSYMHRNCRKRCGYC